MDKDPIQQTVKGICSHISEEAQARDEYMKNVWYLLINIEIDQLPEYLIEHYEQVREQTKQYLKSR